MNKKELSPFELSLASGEIVFREGEPCREMYYVRKGKVKLTVGKNGYEKILDVLEDGEFFGEMALIENNRRIATAIALEDTELLIIDKYALEEQLNDNPVINHILTTVVQRLRDITDSNRSINMSNISASIS